MTDYHNKVILDKNEKMAARTSLKDVLLRMPVHNTTHFNDLIKYLVKHSLDAGPRDR